MESVRKIFNAAMPSQSYSIYRGVEEEDEAELHIDETPHVVQRTNPKGSGCPISPQYQKFIFIICVAMIVAFILGFVVTRHPCTSCDPIGDYAPDEPFDQDEPIRMDWAELKDLFTKYLSDGQEITEKIRKFSASSHPLGSKQNDDLASIILQTFKEYNLDQTFVESHFVELPFPNRSQRNNLNIVDSSNTSVKQIPIEDEDVYCPYSAIRRVKGGLVYVNYGRQEDFKDLTAWKINVSGALVILRAGKISFAEKVYNAQGAGAIGVLIFPEYGEKPVYGHVHFGTGDPNTPGFPSFNHTQFPSFRSSGLPDIPAQPISLTAAKTLLQRLAGPFASESWRAADFPSHGLGPALSDRDHQVQLEVTNIRQSKELHNVFGTITGRVEPEHYIVVGAQRDSWGPGAAKSGVGTATLLELARTMSMMVHNGFQPRRTIIFVSWDGGDFGSIGATEWLEGYLSMLHLKAATYMSLDTPVLGDDNFIAKASPLFNNLIDTIIKQVDHPLQSKQSIYDYMKVKSTNWRSEVMAPLRKDSSAFAFTAFAGVPALEFSFVENLKPYKFLDTKDDTYQNLNSIMNNRLPSVALSVAQVAGLALIKLSHDHILPLDYTAYNEVLLKHLVNLQTYQDKLKTRGLTFEWLYSARGDYNRATQRLRKAITHSDLHNEKVIQFFNVRIMRVEFYFLSQYVSAIDFPYRHILLGRGEHTLEALMEHLTEDQEDIDDSRLRKQIALFTWTLEGAANALSGEVWEVQRSF
ncbi:transferrin receptor protein 2 [Hyla sarda]|uniref:transferrin receptor protein 2 n=1 Tax=Hyla sarda TaxID=327740 RepID=UPI0024C2F62B|nr:transferrin receptor protein 2 [Hyla sarda]XP_056425927.1 transferrin receptor protein 2 [Hyla sarda]XP_056425928.1 transferrin receptor protein 2 [Hyla sarda]